MSEKTGIAWTDHTFNPWWGCTKVSPGCDNCYAEGIAKRFHPGAWGLDGARRVFEDGKHWRAPLGWNAKAERNGTRMRVFCASMADLFDKHPVAEEYRPEVWTLIHKTPWLDWQLLTKRIGNVSRMVPPSWMNGHWPRNAWLGASVVNQEEADRDIPKLLQTSAAVRFISYEPALGPVYLDPIWLIDYDIGAPDERLHWVIIGGESGSKARPFDIQWARNVIAQCRDAGVAVFMKQTGTDHSLLYERVQKDRAGADPLEWPEDLRVREFPVAAQ